MGNGLLCSSKRFRVSTRILEFTSTKKYGFENIKQLTAFKKSLPITETKADLVSFVDPITLLGFPETDRTNQQDFAEQIAEYAKSVLKPREWEVLRQRYLEGKTFREVGEEIKISLTGAEKIEKRALEHLRQAIKPLLNLPQPL